jgi:hypothetical protein
MIDKKLRDVASDLYVSGKSQSEISSIMGVAQSTISRWVLDSGVLGSRINEDRNKRVGAKQSLRYKNQRDKWRDAGRNKDINNLDVIVAGLYWGEGNKSDGMWGIVNSDPEVIRVSRDWLISVGVCPDNIKMVARAYLNNGITKDDVSVFWSKTGQDAGKIKVVEAHTSKESVGARIPNSYGTCLIKTYGGCSELYEMTIGIIQAVLGSDIEIKGGKKIFVPDVSMSGVSVYPKRKTLLVCGVCGKEFTGTAGSKTCSDLCRGMRSRKFDISREELYELVWSHPTTAVAKMFNVTDKAIERRCRLLGVEKPPLGYWTKVKYGKIERRDMTIGDVN